MCSERHWVTETCVTRYKLVPPAKRIVETAIEELRNAGAVAPVIGKDIGPWHPSPGKVAWDDNDAKRAKDGRVKVSWSQAICSGCYDKRYPQRPPVKFVSTRREQCCDCGMPTSEGIYMREDPMTVRFPRVVRDE